MWYRRRLPVAVIYTVGDIMLTQVSPTLFTVSAERAGAIAYFDTRAAAVRRGHEMAKGRNVSFWSADAIHSASPSLIATYRPIPL